MQPMNGVRQMRLVVEVDDFDRAVAFYRDVLGMPEQAAFNGDGDARVAILDAGRATLELANRAQQELVDAVEVGRPATPKVRIALEVDDAAATSELLEKAGATVLGGPTRTPWHSMNARLEAPADLQLTIFQELESLEARSRRAGFSTQPPAEVVCLPTT